MSSFIDFTGKKFFVVGASSGIGEACAQACAELGGEVYAASRRGTLSSANPSIDPLVLDVRDQNQIRQVVGSINAVDGLVYATGRKGLAPVNAVDPAMLDDVIDTNFTGFVYLLKEMMRSRKLSNGGSIVTISSIAAHTGTEGILPYTASKAALSSASRVLGRELARRKIKVNSISPGMVRTPFFAQEEKDYLDNIERAAYPLGLGEPADVAAAAVFLLSDRANFITGADMIMAGGCTWVL